MGIKFEDDGGCPMDGWMERGGEGIGGILKKKMEFGMLKRLRFWGGGGREKIGRGRGYAMLCL